MRGVPVGTNATSTPIMAAGLKPMSGPSSTV